MKGTLSGGFSGIRLLRSTFTRVDYELYRYVNNEPEGKLYRLIPDIDSYQITVKKGDTNSYSSLKLMPKLMRRARLPQLISDQ